MDKNYILEEIDNFISGTMNTYGILFLRYSVGIIFIWFGFLKPLGISPAQDLVANTVYWFEDKMSFVKFLGWWEVVIGLTMIYKPLIRVSIFLLFIQKQSPKWSFITGSKGINLIAEVKYFLASE